MPYSLLEAKSIEQLCKVVDCEHKTAPYVDESEYLVVRTSNVRNGQLLMEGMKYTTSDGFKEWTVRAVPEYGDVLFTREAPAGESCLVPSDKKICMGQRMVMLRANKLEVDPLFLSMILNTERTRADILRLSIGSTVSRINIADIKKLKIASPPLTEQRKIANILETWNKAISTTERLISNSNQQKQALMQQLFTGNKRLLDDSGKQFDCKWTEIEIGKLTKIYDGTHSTPKYVESGIPFYSVEHLTRDDFSHTKFISEEVFEKENKRVKLEQNDILMTRIGDIGTAKCLTWDVQASFYVSLALIKSCESFNSQYLTYYINSNEFHRELWKRTIHVAFPKKINLGEIGHCLVQLPPLEEQQKIAAVLTSADKEIKILEQQLADLKQEKTALMQQLLTGKRRVKI